jgi:Uma2 family endonuclease
LTQTLKEGLLMREGTMLLDMALTEQDLLKVQRLFPAFHTELRGGKLIIMSPSGPRAEWIGTNLAGILNNWVVERSAGFVFGSSAGFVLPSGDIVAPDITFVSRVKMTMPPREFARVVPDLAIEVKSPSDRIAELEDKIATMLREGVQVVALVDPDQRRVIVQSPQGRALLQDGDSLAFPTVLPGWSISVADLWPKDLTQD